MPLSNIKLNSLWYVGNRFGSEDFMCSFKISSMPEDLLFLRDLTALIISFSVIGLLISSFIVSCSSSDRGFSVCSSVSLGLFTFLKCSKRSSSEA